MDTGTDRRDQSVDEGSGYDAGEGVSEAVRVRLVDERGIKRDFEISDDGLFTTIEFGFFLPNAVDVYLRDGILYLDIFGHNGS